MAAQRILGIILAGAPFSEGRPCHRYISFRLQHQRGNIASDIKHYNFILQDYRTCQLSADNV